MKQQPKKPLLPLLIYFCVGVVVVFQTVTTLLHSAVSLTHHARYNSLEKEKRTLSLQIQTLQSQLATKTSVRAMSATDLSQQFLPIHDWVALSNSDTLAAIQ